MKNATQLELDATIKAINEAVSFGAIAIVVALTTGRNLYGADYGQIVGAEGSNLKDWQRAIFSAAADRVAELWPAFDEDAAKAKVAASREKSAKAYQDREDSFQRCDTDGFLSQWASGLTGQRESRQADIDANGGYDTFRALFDIHTGEEVNAKQITTQFGTSWLLKDGRVSAKTGKPFVPAYASKSNTTIQHGYVEGVVIDKAKAALTGTGTGLSGTCWVTTYRVREEAK